MHRTQILLEDVQYHALRERAGRTGKTIAQLIRAFVDQGLKKERAKSRRRALRLEDLSGMVNEPGLASAHHDDVLYGDDR